MPHQSRSNADLQAVRLEYILVDLENCATVTSLSEEKIV